MQPDDIKALRKRMGLTQEQFAAELKVSRVLLNQMERGLAPIETRTIIKICALGVMHNIDLRPEAEIVMARRFKDTLRSILQRHGVHQVGDDELSSDARDLLHCLREPTHSMQRASATIDLRGIPASGLQYWSAMIDAAIADQ